MIRSGTKRRLVAVMGHVLPEVNVAYTWAGDNATDSTLWLGESLGALEPETIGTEKLERDEWTIRCSMVLFGFDDPLLAEDAVNDALTSIDDALRRNRRLTGIDGLSDGDVASYRGLYSVRLSDVDGPFHSNPQLMGGDLIPGSADFGLLCIADLPR